MNMDQFMDQLLAAAAQAGIETAEVFCESGDNLSASSIDGAITSYEVSSTCGLSLRGTMNGRMGYASTQAFDEAAIGQLIEGVKESAELAEAEEQDEIFAGETEYPPLAEPETDANDVPAEDKLAMCLALENAAKAADARVWKVETSVSTGTETVRLKNSFGLDLTWHDSLCYAYAESIIKDGDATGTGGDIRAAKRFDALSAETIGRQATAESVANLHGSPVEAGAYRVIFRNDAMTSLLRTFSGIFSAENAQQNMSLLGGKEGTVIAAPCVTLMDDPLLPGGMASRPFDAEGSACRTKAVIDAGTLTTLLHSRKTARKQGVETTGNASRPSYTSPVRVAPSNFFFKPGEKSLEELMTDMGNGLVITDLSGLHSGANPTSGDFSLLSKGYTVENGKRGHAVEQITVAGNFYELLKNIRAIGNDLVFFSSSVASPSVDAGTLQVSGK